MRQLMRLVRYALPYWWHILCSVVLMALVGALDAFKFLLIRPIFDRVLNPSTGSKDIQLFVIAHHPVFLQQLVPSRFTNAWTMVAVALVGSTVLKGVCDYTGTYLVNHAGFGMITDLRDDLYNAIMRRSAAFFSKHTTAATDKKVKNCCRNSASTVDMAYCTRSISLMMAESSVPVVCLEKNAAERRMIAL